MHYILDKANQNRKVMFYGTTDLAELFAGVFEIIYQVRNNLIHGHMNPGDNEYEVVKHCYFVLYDLMSF